MLFINQITKWFRERSRNIFHFHDGERWRRADPVAAGTALERECPDYQEVLSTLAKRVSEVPPGPIRTQLVKQQQDAAVKLATVARKVFNLPPLDPTGTAGVTDGEAVGVLTKYFVFMEELARSAELFPDSPGAGSVSPPA